MSTWLLVLTVYAWSEINTVVIEMPNAVRCNEAAEKWRKAQEMSEFYFKTTAVCLNRELPKPVITP